MLSESFIRSYPPATAPGGPAHRFLFQSGKLLIGRGVGAATLPSDKQYSAVTGGCNPILLGALAGKSILACEVDADAPVPAGLSAVGLRDLYGLVSEELYSIAGYASQILYWLATSRFCPVCGGPTTSREGDWGRLCTVCGHVGHPRISPATLMLVHDEDRILLAHKPGWGKRFSILAGFVEPGESLEECVRREVLEEVSLHVDDLRYTCSQAWPFPHQLMIGFTARHCGGEIRVDGVEIDDARWFPAESLPDLPPPLSLSRQMIDAWVRSFHGG